MRPDVIQVYKTLTPKPAGAKDWQVEALREGMFDDEILTGWEFDTREEAVEFAKREARDTGADLVVEGEHVGGVRHKNDWEGAEWQEFGGFG